MLRRSKNQLFECLLAVGEISLSVYCVLQQGSDQNRKFPSDCLPPRQKKDRKHRSLAVARGYVF